MEKDITPYACHVFVCVNNRHGTNPSCTDKNGYELRLQLKNIFKEKGYESHKIRVSQSLCLGQCHEGANVMIYPQQIWLKNVTLDDTDKIVQEIETIINS